MRIKVPTQQTRTKTNLVDAKNFRNGVVRSKLRIRVQPRIPGGGRVEQAKRLYDSLLKSTDIPAFAESLQSDMRSKRVLYGERLVCDFLRPNFVHRKQLHFVADAITKVHQAMDVLATRVLSDKSLQEFMALSEVERWVLKVDPRFSGFSWSGRADGFLTDTGMRFVEYNGEAPLGNGYMDKLAEAFASTSVMRRFTQSFRCEPLFGLNRLLATLLHAHAAWGGKERPVIAIVDYPGLKSDHEFHILKEHFEARGVETHISDPRDLELTSNKELTFHGRKIDLVYRRVLLSDCLDKFQDVENLYHAVNAGTVCMVNPFRNKLFHNKAMFALLTDPQHQQGMSPAQVRAVSDYLPWTRRVGDSKTQAPDGLSVDLLDYIAKNQQTLVLKPTDEYGGKGVMIGWEMSASEWTEAINSALRSPHVVQHRVKVARSHFPRWNKDGLSWNEYTVDLNPFMCGGQLASVMARLSPSAVCNICAGGGAVPTFVIDS